jgi:transcriptional regulator with XRE-family HTH domain
MNTLESRLGKAFNKDQHTQAALAKAAGVKPPSVADWFNGKTRTLKAEPLVRAAIYLGVEPLWLAAGEGPMHRSGFTAREPTAAYESRPAWPFTRLSEASICSLSREELALLEGLILGVAHAHGLTLANRRAA